MKEKNKMNHHEYKAVIFDMDGVIFDSERCCLECWCCLQDKYDLKDMEATFRKCTGTTREKTKEILLESYGKDFPVDSLLSEASVLFHSKYDNGKLPIKEGVHEILKALMDEKIKIALASSTRRVTVLKELSDAGLLSYFDAIITGDMVTRSKPAPDIFLKACEVLGVSPSEAYGIEDSYNGIRSLASGGLRPIMVPDMLMPTDEMRKLSEIILNDLIQVKNFLLE